LQTVSGMHDPASRRRSFPAFPSGGTVIITSPRDNTDAGDSMVRTQIQLTERESAALKEASQRSGLSVAELIRQSVDRFLEDMGGDTLRGAGRLSALEIVGRFDSGLTDVSARHDEYLAEAYLGGR
jgi:hypothetical protein